MIRNRGMNSAMAVPCDRLAPSMPTRKLYIGRVSVWLIGPPRVSTYTTVNRQAK